MNNVTIMDKNGNGLLAEGICYINLTDNGASKNYIFYTLNETVENGLTKIYIAEVTNGPSDVRISDEEWANIKKIMVSILHAEDLPNIVFNKFDGSTFNISEPKKLAIDMVKKQTLMDVQNSKVLAAAQNVPQNESAGPGSFFNPADAVENTTPVVQDAGIPNIFENPIQPEIAPQQLGGIDDPTKVPINNVAETSAPITENTQVVEEVPTMDQTLVTSTQDVSAMPEEAAVAAPIQNNKPSMEEVKQALDVLNRYFNDTTNVLVSSPIPEIVPSVIEHAPIPTPVVPEAPVAVESVNTVPEIPAGNVETTMTTQAVINSVPEVPVAPVMPEAPVEPVMFEAPVAPEVPVAPVVPETPQVVPVGQMVQDANVASVPVEPVIPGNTAPVQMPTDVANPGAINTAGFEGLAS